MGKFLIRVVINAIAIAVTASVLSGIQVKNNDLGTLLIIGLVFGIVNATIKPILIFMTCPAVILSLGLFILIINGVLLMITDSLVGDRLTVDGFGTAILGGIIMGILSIIMETVLGLREKKDHSKHEKVIEYKKLN
jgi:putative membrane protein